ncbi:MAG TPA: copper chaperone PCu(A)C [Burkholderiales bacterium]|nr:copper chaperone PCu(A)C [Burkholderiales bacterium]
MIVGRSVRAARATLCATILLLAPGLSHADAGVKVSDAWARATAPGQSVAAAYLNVVSVAPAALVRAESPVARVVELHEMKMDGDVMKMRAIPKVDLPAGTTVQLAPGGLHVMLIDIQQPLKVGEKVPLTLVIESGGETEKLSVEAEVRDARGGAAHH